MLGASLQELGFTEERRIAHVAVKEAVLPFAKFPNVDAVLGPEMKSTGEVMGVDANFGLAFAKSQIAANGFLPTGGTAFLSVRDHDKLAITALATRLVALGFKLLATEGTAEVIQRAGVPVERVYKVTEGFRPHIVDRMKNGEVTMVVNTPEGRSARLDSYSIRRTAVTMGIPHFTTMAAAEAAAEAIGALRKQQMTIRSLQEYHAPCEVPVHAQIAFNRPMSVDLPPPRRRGARLFPRVCRPGSSSWCGPRSSRTPSCRGRSRSTGSHSGGRAAPQWWRSSTRC